jgi:hypothetical protein
VKQVNKKLRCIECEIYDATVERKYYHYNGRISQIGGFLYWEFRPDQQDAVSYGCSFIPTGEKNPGFTIYGIFLTAAGGETREWPVAARAALRFLGETPDEAVQRSVVETKGHVEAEEELLRTKIGGYLPDLNQRGYLRVDVFEEIQKTIIPNITNEVSNADTPFALTMPHVQ